MLQTVGSFGVVQRPMAHSIPFARSGKVKPVVDSVFAFEDALKAYERIMARGSTGKVVVKIDPSVE